MVDESSNQMPPAPPGLGGFHALANKLKTGTDFSDIASKAELVKLKLELEKLIANAQTNKGTSAQITATSIALKKIEADKNALQEQLDVQLQSIKSEILSWTDSQKAEFQVAQNADDLPTAINNFRDSLSAQSTEELQNLEEEQKKLNDILEQLRDGSGTKETLEKVLDQIKGPDSLKTEEQIAIFKNMLNVAQRQVIISEVTNEKLKQYTDENARTVRSIWEAAPEYLSQKMSQATGFLDRYFGNVSGTFSKITGLLQPVATRILNPAAAATEMKEVLASAKDSIFSSPEGGRFAALKRGTGTDVSSNSAMAQRTEKWQARMGQSVGFAQETSEAIGEMTKHALTAGSLYTHDVTQEGLMKGLIRGVAGIRTPAERAAETERFNKLRALTELQAEILSEGVRKPLSEMNAREKLMFMLEKLKFLFNNKFILGNILWQTLKRNWQVFLTEGLPAIGGYLWKFKEALLLFLGSMGLKKLIFGIPGALAGLGKSMITGLGDRMQRSNNGFVRWLGSKFGSPAPTPVTGIMGAPVRVMLDDGLGLGGRGRGRRGRGGRRTMAGRLRTARRGLSSMGRTAGRTFRAASSAISTAGSGLTTMGRGAASMFRGGLATTLGKVAGPLAGVIGAAAALPDVIDTLRDPNATGEQKGSSTGAMAGSAIGATAGAILGSALGPVGTMVGGWLGEKAGSFLGETVGGWIGSFWDDEEEKKTEEDKTEEQKKTGIMAAATGLVGAGIENIKSVGGWISSFWDDEEEKKTEEDKTTLAERAVSAAKTVASFSVIGAGIEGVKGIGSWVSSFWSTKEEGLEAKTTAVTGLIGAGIENLKGAGSLIGMGVDSIKNAAGGVLGAGIDGIKNAAGWISSFWSDAGEKLGEGTAAAGSLIGSGIDSLKNTTGSWISAGIDGIKGIGSLIGSGIDGLKEVASGDWISTGIEGLKSAGGLIGAGLSNLKGVAGWIGSFWDDKEQKAEETNLASTTLIGAGIENLKSAAGWLGSFWNDEETKTETVSMEKVQGAVTAGIENIKEVGSSIWDWAGNALGTLKNTATTLISSIDDKLPEGILNAIPTTGVISAITAGLNSVKTTVADGTNNIAQTVASNVNNSQGMVSQTIPADIDSFVIMMHNKMSGVA